MGSPRPLERERGRVRDCFAELEYASFRPLTSILSPCSRGEAGKPDAVSSAWRRFIKVPRDGSYSLAAEAAFPHRCVLDFRRVESTEAILLRKRKFSDTSLIVSWCTESLGCVQTIAKGARRPKSPFAGKLDLFFEAEISIVRSRKSDLHTLTEVVLKNPFAGIRSNYLRTQSAAYFVELIEICTERDHREPELFGLLRRAFGYLDANDPTARAVAHFETELARIAGVHDQTRLKADPAFALGNLFGRLPLSRTPLLKTLATEAKENVPMNCVWLAPKAQRSDEAWGNALGIRTSRRTSALTARFTDALNGAFSA